MFQLYHIDEFKGTMGIEAKRLSSRERARAAGEDVRGDRYGDRERTSSVKGEPRVIKQNSGGVIVERGGTTEFHPTIRGDQRRSGRTL